MIISLTAYRQSRRIVEVLPVQYNDVVIEHARKIERWFREMEAAMEGNPKPGDTE